jgi:hypothetical protein
MWTTLSFLSFHGFVGGSPISPLAGTSERGKEEWTDVILSSPCPWAEPPTFEIVRTFAPLILLRISGRDFPPQRETILMGSQWAM